MPERGWTSPACIELYRILDRLSLAWDIRREIQFPLPRHRDVGHQLVETGTGGADELHVTLHRRRHPARRRALVRRMHMRHFQASAGDRGALDRLSRRGIGKLDREFGMSTDRHRLIENVEPIAL